MNKIEELYEIFNNLDEQASERGMTPINYLAALTEVKLDNPDTLENVNRLRTVLDSLFGQLNEEEKKHVFDKYNFITERLILIKEILSNYMGKSKNYSKEEIDFLLDLGIYASLNWLQKDRVKRAERMRRMPENYLRDLFKIETPLNLRSSVVVEAKTEELFRGVRFNIDAYGKDSDIKSVSVSSPKHLLGDFIFSKTVGDFPVQTTLHAKLVKQKKPWHQELFVTFQDFDEALEFLRKIKNPYKRNENTDIKNRVMVSVIAFLSKQPSFNPGDVFVNYWNTEVTFLRGIKTVQFSLGEKMEEVIVRSNQIVHYDKELGFSLVRLNNLVKHPITKEDVTVWLTVNDFSPKV